MLSDHWTDVCAAFGDEDAHHLYVSPRAHPARARRAGADLAVGDRRRPGDRAARAVGGHGGALAGGGRAGAREARALRLQDGGGVSPPRRGRARGLQPRSAEGDVAGRGGRTSARQVLEPSLRFAAASLREGFIAPALKLAVFPEHRLLRRRRAERRIARRCRRRRAGGRAGGAALVHRAARGRHRGARGPRRGAVRGL